MTTPERLVAELVGNELLTGATLSKPRRSDPSRPAKVTVAPVLVQGALRYRWTFHHGTHAVDENLAPDETERRLAHLLGGEFRQALLHATDADWQVLAGRSRSPSPPPRPQAPGHDRVKARSCPRARPCRSSIELGVMTPDGKVRARRYDVPSGGPFLELVGGVLDDLPAGSCASSTSAQAGPI
jgi:hypothetical protein